MSNGINMKEVLKTGAVLFAITALSAALLSFVNAKTKPFTEQNSVIAENNSMRAVLPEAADFKAAEITEEMKAEADKIGGEVEKAYTASDASGETIGVCVITNTTGYDIGIETVTGIGLDGRVSGVEIISMNETPGLGANASKPEFTGQYTGKTGLIEVSKTGADDTHIEAISGATKTSKGVTNGVNIALGIAKIMLNGGGE